MFDLTFYRGKKVFITGHTGFKGTWMCKILEMAGAEVYGYSLMPTTNPSLYNILQLDNYVHSRIGDVRNLGDMLSYFSEVQPEIVIHMAAQPIVRESYRNPVYTYETNVLGTVNVLECVRQNDCVKSVINVTTDKVYLNREWEWGYRENEELNGYDPYSNSKSCSELVTSSYIKSFFGGREIAITTCRAGNVIGGGDYAKDRIIPDCIRAAYEEKNIILRNPYSVRPYQHVLEPVLMYLEIAKKQYFDKSCAGCFNIGPEEDDCRTTGEIATLFCNKWNQINNSNINWVNIYDGGPHEANFLKLDCSKIKRVFGWRPCFHIEQVIDMIVEFAVAEQTQEVLSRIMEKQILSVCTI